MNLKMLYEKDNNESYTYLKELLSRKDDSLYPYINDFFKLLSEDKSFIKIRGVSLIASLAKYDKDNIISKNIDKITILLTDDISIVVRSTISSLKEILKYKPELKENIFNSLNDININKYKESMQSLIKRDIEDLRK